MQSNQTITDVETSKNKTEEKGKSEIQGIREEIRESFGLLEELVMRDGEVKEREVLGSLERLGELLGRVGKIESVSEYNIVERHALGALIVRGILLAKMAGQGSTGEGVISTAIERIESKYNWDMLSRNLKVCAGELDRGKGILLESLFLHILQIGSGSLLRKVEVARIIGLKARAKARLIGRMDRITTYILRTVEAIIDQSIETMIPISRQTAYEKICEIVEGIIATNNKAFLVQLIFANMYTSQEMYKNALLNPKNILVRLSGHEDSEKSGEEREKSYALYKLVLKVVVKYLRMRKAEEPQIAGKSILEEIFDEDEVEMMVKLVEKEMPAYIQAEILNILVEGEVILHKADTMAVTPSNIYPLARYALQHRGTEAVLANIINALELDVVEAENEDEMELSAREHNPVLVLDFINEMMRRYVVEVSENSYHFQKYIAGPVLDAYNTLVQNTSNPLITTGYLALLSTLTNLEESATNQSGFASSIQRNLVLAKSITGIIATVRQVCAYSIQKETLYTECPISALPDELLPVVMGQGAILQGAHSVFRLCLFLPPALQITVASRHLMGILFRVLAEEESSLSCSTLYFIREFFKNKSVVQKISNAINSRFFYLMAALVSLGELDTVLDILAANQRIYHSFFRNQVVTPRSVSLFKEMESLYALLATLMVYYYADDPKLKNEAINRSLVGLFDEVIRSLKSHANIVPHLVDTPEFGYFFKAAALLSTEIALNVKDLLYLIMKAQISTADIDPRKPNASLIYRSPSKMVSECFFFYHFVSAGLSGALVSDEKIAGHEILAEVNNPFSTNALKYIALLGLSSENAGYKSPAADLFANLDLTGVGDKERLLFVNQIYRALFLSGSVQEGGPAISLPFPGTPPQTFSTTPSETPCTEASAYSYADMCLRSAIKATEETGAPHTLPINIVAAGTPPLIAAFLYTLHEAAPSSAIILSYIKKMRKFVREDESVFARVLSTIPTQ
ncbi:hypothetical protein NEHOM01_0136 [Nematocida homosporus]|uniref:uncharacterized protein n=1 Tax=Nematocida homosporus TaxID=1912981 RepID=UPI00221F154E|nr:uncharacterized protein NEHOM01_0136 [Nematocida homosporus]KAI5184391.1 hypothetical protein NEHOM01_0136 [Nematocida homosporus]